MPIKISKNHAIILVLGLIPCVAIPALFILSPSLNFDTSLLGISDNTIRTIAHINVFGIISFCLARTICFKQHILTFTLCTIIATTDELSQLTIPYRSATLEDWTCNIIGISLWLTISYRFPPSCERLNKRYPL